MAAKTSLMVAGIADLAAYQIGLDNVETYSAPATLTSNFAIIGSGSGNVQLTDPAATYCIVADVSCTIVPVGNMLINGASTLALSSGQQAMLIPNGNSIFAVVSGTPPPPPALDGSSTISLETNNTPLSLNLTTTAAPGIIVVALISHNNVGSITCTASGLTFSQRFYEPVSNTGEYVFSAPYSTNFSGTITVTDPSASGFMAGMAFGVSSAVGFDPNSSLPAVNTTSGQVSTAPFSTTNSKDFLYLFGVAGNTGGNSPPTGWNLLPPSSAPGSYFDAYYQIVSSTQSDVTVPLNSSYEYSFTLVDALE